MKTIIAQYPSSQVYVLADKNTVKLLPVLGLDAYPALILCAGEENKTLDSVASIWDFLIEHQATRHSLLINVGGGVITDMGGFAASTFKRGIDYMNVPTSLLAMVDAATGGKTGFDYRGLKNEIGLFRQPVKTVFETRVLRSLPMLEIMSGLSEMIKHALISDADEFKRLMAIGVEYDFTQDAFAERVMASVAIKEHVVAIDPTEKGLRKSLNFGHTIGHAIESLSMEQGTNMRHGYAVMYGMIAELYLSHVLCGLEAGVITILTHYVIENYGRINISCRHYDRLLELMHHDKKNGSADQLNFVLLAAIGEPKIDQVVAETQVREALDYLFSI